jgi:hypothetical protein
MKIRQPGDQQPQVVGEIQSAYGYIRRQKWTNPIVGAVDSVHAAITLLTTVQNITTAITNPDFPRIISIKGTKAGGSLTGNVVITGTNIRNEVITDTIAINTNDSEVFGVKAFKTVTNIALPVRASAGDTVTVGMGDALGLDRCMNGNEVILMTADGVYETTRPTVTFDVDEVEKNTVNPNTTIDGSADFAVSFVSTEKTSKRNTTV